MLKLENNTPRQIAVIYARVSGAKQVRDGDGLASQESRCREYAEYKNYEVIGVFNDDMSGKFVKRPAMDEMLTFLRKHRSHNPVVIIDDISRLARGLEAHLKLRQSLSSAGGKLESLLLSLATTLTVLWSRTCLLPLLNINVRRMGNRP